MKKKVVLYIHGGDLDIYPKQKDYYKNIYSYTINHCDFIIVNSAYIKNKVISTFNISLENVLALLFDLEAIISSFIGIVEII